MSETGRQHPLLGYALNVFPYNSLAGLWECLEQEVLQIKDRVFPNEPFPIELRFSERIVSELTAAPNELARLKDFLERHDLWVVTVNGFVMPAFHGEPVKERVYLPAWQESNARLRFTNDCVDLLQRLSCHEALGDAPSLIPSVTVLSVSVPFGALKPVRMEAVAPNILACGRYAAQRHQETGVRVVVALEPEPGLCVETTDEVIEFFERFVPADLRPYLGVNFDLAHQLVQFEDPAESLARLAAPGILVAKIHVSNAAAMEELRAFYDDSIYLHQVCGANARGQRVYFSLDWPTQPPPAGIAQFRVHYHLPVCPMTDLNVGTTLGEVEQFLVGHCRQVVPDAVTPLVIETYTWPQQRRGRERLVDNVCRELVWVREKICLCQSPDPL